MKDEFNLISVLEHVASGKTPVNKAKNMIEKHFSVQEIKIEKAPPSFDKTTKAKNKDAFPDTLSSQAIFGKKDKLKNAFDKFKKTVNLDDFFKMSSQFVQQISENVPQKIHENFVPIGFSAKNAGISEKLSVFRGMDLSPKNTVEENQVVGCHWFGVHISEESSVKQNKFMAMQLTEFILRCCDLCESHLSLSRMSHVTMQESCFVKNKLSLSTWSDTSLTESDFTENILSRCDFSGTVINSSRLSKLKLTNIDFQDCEFDACDIQGIEFDNCEFKDCYFHHINAVSPSPVKISGYRIQGKQFSQCRSVQEFIDMLKKN